MSLIFFSAYLLEHHIALCVCVCVCVCACVRVWFILQSRQNLREAHFENLCNWAKVPLYLTYHFASKTYGRAES